MRIHALLLLAICAQAQAQLVGECDIETSGSERVVINGNEYCPSAERESSAQTAYRRCYDLGGTDETVKTCLGELFQSRYVAMISRYKDAVAGFHPALREKVFADCKAASRAGQTENHIRC